MSMKKTDLEKNKAMKLGNALRGVPPPDRFGKESTLDRKERRKIDQARGLIPFAVKLEQTLVTELRAAAEASGKSVDDAVAELLRRGLAAGPLELAIADEAKPAVEA